MSQRLVYVMGPSGAGKDSVLGWMRQQLPAGADLHWARRTVTRDAQAGGEAHEAVTGPAFDALVARGAFAMHWRANGLGYGIRQEEFAPLARGGWVVVNGSREYFGQARLRFPLATGLHITADEATLARRLLARGRESEQQVAERVARARAFRPPAGVIEVRNDGELADAGRQALEALARLPGWPARVSPPAA